MPTPVVSAHREHRAVRRRASAVDAGDRKVAAAHTVFLDVRPRSVLKACDIGTVDLMVAEVENLQEYRYAGVRGSGCPWHELAAAPLQWTHAPDEPLVLAVPSHALRNGPAARLNLKVQPLAVCDPRVHPQVVHNSEQGRLAWKGRDAARLSLALYARPLPLPDPKLGPAGIAAPTQADAQQVEIASCGLRDAGAPFGDVAIELQVYPAVQWLMELRHAGFEPMQWPAAGSARRLRPRSPAGSRPTAARATPPSGNVVGRLCSRSSARAWRSSSTPGRV